MKKIHKAVTGALATAGILLATLGTVAPANATTNLPTPEPGQSCGIDADTGASVCVNPGEDLNKAVLEKLHFRAIIPEGAHGKTIPASEVPAGTKSKMVVGEFDRDTNWGGGTPLVIYKEDFCSAGHTDNVTNLGSWDNQISSFKTFSYCKAKLWDRNNYSGASYGYSTGASSLGAMNDATSSIQLTK